MSIVSIGEGIVSSGEMPLVPTPEPGPIDMPQMPTPGAGFDVEQIKANVREEMRHELSAAVADIERRLGQAREIEQANLSGVPRQTVHAEDLNLGFAMIDGYTLTANSPGAGSIAWSSLHVVLLGVDYTITDANTALKYAWFVKPGSYTPGTPIPLSTSNTLPTLGANDALIFINNGGTPVSVLESSIVYAVGAGAIGNSQLDSATQTLLSTLQANDIAMQGRIDGVITSYYQDNAPWAAGAPSPGGGDVNMGDIWYDSNDGGAFRWTGASGSPTPNAWQRIADTDTSALAAKVNTKVSTYLATNAIPPVAPSGGFSAGDMWMVTDQGNKLKRWSGSAWVDVLIGDGAIASGISGAKIGTGIDATNITAGTLVAARVGAGVAGAALGSATGTIGTSQIASGAVGATQLATSAVTPAKINAAFHILY